MSPDAATEEQQPTFEQALERLKEINARFEGGELSLDEAIRLYEEGGKLVKLCEEQLSRTDQVVKLITEKPSGEIEEEDLESTS